MFEQEEREFNKDAAQWAKKLLLNCHNRAPAMWWCMYCRHVCADIAVKVLSQTITSSECERYISVFLAILTQNSRQLCAPKMVCAVKVYFANYALEGHGCHTLPSGGTMHHDLAAHNVTVSLLGLLRALHPLLRAHSRVLQPMWGQELPPLCGHSTLCWATTWTTRVSSTMS